MSYDLYGQMPEGEQPVADETAQSGAAEQKEPKDNNAQSAEVSTEVQPPISTKIDGKANIAVVGVGGGGCNAINNMVRANIKGVHFAVMNTDKQALNLSPVDKHCKIQLGKKTTEGLGAGSNPEVGRAAALESRSKIEQALQGIDLLFITAGMGGGTGTGAAPIIAEVAKSLGILTVAVVTKPFEFEGGYRMKNAEEGIANLRDYVDTLLVIPNQKLVECFKDQRLTMKRAFEIADDVLRQGVQGVSDVITNPELVNLDFADVRTILTSKGLAHMGIGYGKGEMRILEAVKGAISNPLLEVSIEGAKGVIINIVGGDDLMLDEVSDACAMIRDVVDPEANLIFGMSNVENKQDVEITIIATGFLDNKHYIPAKMSGSAPTPRPAQTLESALAAADNQAKTARMQPNMPQQSMPSYPQRPTFGGQRPQPIQPVQPAPQPRTEQSPVQPRTTQQPPQNGRPSSSRIDVPTYTVPPFLRRLRGNNDEENN